MGFLSDLNQVCKSGDETQVRQFLCENSAREECRSSYAMLWDAGIGSSAHQTAADRRMMSHEFEVVCSAYV